MNKVMNAVSEYLREDFPNFRSGDTINVGVKVVEGSKSRIQNFEGVVMGRALGLVISGLKPACRCVNE